MWGKKYKLCFRKYYKLQDPTVKIEVYPQQLKEEINNVYTINKILFQNYYIHTRLSEIF